MGEVVDLPVITRLDLPPERILSAALSAGLESVVIAGFTKDGEFYGASSYADGGDVLWALEMLKRKMFAAAEGRE